MLEHAHEEAWSFLKAASGYTEADALEAHFERVLRAFGFDRYAFARIDDQADPTRPVPIASNGTQAWDRYRVEQRGYVECDPCMIWARAGKAGFSWSEVRDWSIRTGHEGPTARALWGDAAAAGMNNGLAFRGIGPAGELLLTRLMTGEAQIRPADRAILDSVCVVFSTMRIRMHQGASERPVDLLLTPREAECLRWAGHGLTDPEVADILGISRRTVGVHIENAKRKLGARTRLAAFSRAQDLRLLAR